jgi:hypothetical protein
MACAGLSLPNIIALMNAWVDRTHERPTIYVSALESVRLIG